MNLKNPLLLFSAVLLFQNAEANDRHFNYTYESEVLGKGFKELEIWTTPKIGKDIGYFARFDNRMEFEVGVTKHLQTAFYLSLRQTTLSNESGINETEFEFKGISSEWKYQFSQPHSGWGFALYEEIGLNTDQIEIESKLILDRKIGKTVFALNLTAEQEWELSPGKPAFENKIEETFGLSHEFTKEFWAGFELRQHNVFTKDEGLEHSALFGGPVVSYFQPSWWAAFTVLPQIISFKEKTSGSSLDLSEYTKLESRLIFSFRM